MISHEYQLHWKDLGRILFPPLAASAAFCLLIHGAAATGLLPQPKPALDMDRTILIHQANAARTAPEAAVVLIGDSSCLMDVSAVELSNSLEMPVLNLGTLSFLDLPVFAAMLTEYCSNHSNPPGLVLLLLHPEFLRRSEPIAHHVRTVERYYAGMDYWPNRHWQDRWDALLGLPIVKGRLLSRVIPSPLHGEYRHYYGFTRDLWRYLDQHRGSASDPRTFTMGPGLGTPDYRISSANRRTAGTFRTALPQGTRLAVGLAPTARGFAGAGFDPHYRDLLLEWAELTGADLALTNLPATLSDSHFADKSHLNPRGAIEYTRILADSIASLNP